MITISAFPVGITPTKLSPSATPANAIPGQAGTLVPGVPPVSQSISQSNDRANLIPSAVPAAGRPAQSDTDAQGNNTQTTSRGQSGRPDDNKGQETQQTRQEQRQIQELAKRDREVRSHEAAHVAAAGQYVTRGAQFSYTRGPDGKNYAVGGEVLIDTSPVKGDPEATLAKAEAVRAAALAPAQPSSQDRSVAVAAVSMAAQARAEILTQRQAELSNQADNEHPGIRAYKGMDDYFTRTSQTTRNEAVSVHA